MKWSWRLMKVAGIDLYIHVTFFILLIWAGWMGYAARQRPEDALYSVVFILTLFVIVVLHELGHALTARRFGIATRDITLLPIGGVARLERMPDDPRQELLVALAGPAVNVALALVLFGALAFGSQVGGPEQLSLAGGDFFVSLMWVNVILAAFNLLPAFPMDGGRVLRALLAIRMSYVRATNIAANIGQGMALLFGMIGLLLNPFLILIAVFVWMGASQEASLVQMKSALGGIRVGDVMIKNFRTLAPEESLDRAVEHLLAGYQEDFPVIRDGRLAGLLTRTSLVNGLARLGPNLPVADAMEREFKTANPDEGAESVLMRMHHGHCRSMPVLDNGHLVGILTCDNLGEFLMVKAALQSEPRAREMGAHLAERHAT